MELLPLRVQSFFPSTMGVASSAIDEDQAASTALALDFITFF
jgi:hypothetical protein